MLSLNQHIKIFSDFADEHPVIQSFGFGDPWEWYNKLKQEGESLRYPAMFVAPRRSSIVNNKGTRTYTVFFAERQRKGEENENDALSDTEMLWLELLSYITKSLRNTPASLEKNNTAEPHTEFGVDYLAGYTADFSINESFEYNNCTIPIN